MVLGPQIEPIPNQLNNHVVQLGKVALSEIEFKQLTSAMKNVQFNLSDSPMILRVASEEFDEFYAQINVSGEVILIEIKLYKS
jgi:predicted transcriptional regulator